MGDQPVNTCRSCRATIIWALTRNGRRMPLDWRAAADGNVRLERHPEGREMLASVLTGEVLTLARKNEEPLYVSHFATCPNARSHRKAS